MGKDAQPLFTSKQSTRQPLVAGVLQSPHPVQNASHTADPVSRMGGRVSLSAASYRMRAGPSSKLHPSLSARP
ncbi:MAG: hypothetical protein QOE41_4620 [Mycobacterium sp.]|jgi:hypothetical protein|nr:hypothetical protein [Mycobacterium sp.]